MTCASRPWGAGIAARVPSGQASHAAPQSSSPGISYSVCGPGTASNARLLAAGDAQDQDRRFRARRVDAQQARSARPRQPFDVAGHDG